MSIVRPKLAVLAIFEVFQKSDFYKRGVFNKQEIVRIFKIVKFGRNFLKIVRKIETNVVDDVFLPAF